VHDQLLGSTQPVLSISLEPGESIVAETGEFAWMTDSIQMAADALAATAGSLQLSAYTAKDAAGIIAFASRLPGSIVGIDVAPGREYLVHRRAFLAGTPGIEVSTGFRQMLGAGEEAPAEEFILRRIGGRGRAWVELSGDVVRRDLAAGTSLRTHPWHIGMSDASVAVQMADGAHHFAVLSGPGAVWLQSMPLLVAPRDQLAASAARTVPAAEGAAGPVVPQPGSQHHTVNPKSR